MALRNARNPDNARAASASPLCQTGDPVMVGTLLEATVKTFIEDRFALEPVAATVMGYHSHDHRLGDLTADGFAARNEFTQDWLRRFTGMGEDSLDAYQKVDRGL